ncbi:hypothetical protein [Chryseobacterium vrystaatense]|uniref:Outer membrane protein beta-barrel domain-containing protein n=1 Tax=Chryseobacterium vrystaatense TaxID=307480 RepID=A0ABR4UHJ0_9FLAO|nr:hypothetical protein [Chryseobacterium vrystaatense]KFF24045.1 hypothetical protein IW16_21975 [Chryseobacterium vrystaatense]
MKTIVFLFFLFWAGMVLGQDQKSFKERNSVALDCFVYTAAKKKTDSVVRKNIKYSANRQIISFEEDTLKKQPEERSFVTLNESETGIDAGSIITANLKVVDKKIMIYPWYFNYNSKTNKFFDENDVYIKMKDRVNYGFPYRSIQVGLITLPVKWYMDSKIGNIETSLNAMINVGYKFGNSRFVKLPNEEKPREYKTGFSVNGLAGISKIELDENNTSLSQNGIAKGNVAAISLGGSLGYHYNDFTLMIALGFDLPTSNRKNWNFNGVPWLGLGIGYNFLKFN